MRGFLPVNQTAVNIKQTVSMDADMLDLCAIGVVTAAALISSAEKTTESEAKTISMGTPTFSTSRKIWGCRYAAT